MKRIFVLVLVLFAHFTITMVQCLGQDDKVLAKVVEDMYNRELFEHVIFNYDGRWYFATAVVDRSFNRIGNVKQASREKTISFFIHNGKKKYPHYTRFPQDMAVSESIEDTYVLLKEKKSRFYDMPQIAKFKTDISSEVYIFARPIANDPNKSIAQNKYNADLGKISYNSITKASSTITQNRDKSPDNNTSNTNQSSQSVTLVVYGTAESEDDAIKIALRSAIEQAFGTFVSSNTKIVNDELTKDEIVSVASGNIENYSIISSEKESDGKILVSVKATVSISNLIQFAESKGSSVELAGASFAMNMKMIKLNKENEKQALIHMFKKMIKICDMNLFDFRCKTEQPKMSGDKYLIPTTIEISPNLAYLRLVSEFLLALKSLSLTQSEQEIYQSTNIKVYTEMDVPEEYWTSIFKEDTYYVGHFDNRDPRTRMRKQGKTIYYFFGIENLKFALRNDMINLTDSNNKRFIDTILEKILNSYLSFKIEDNIGNMITPNIKDAKKIFDFGRKYGSPRFSYNSAFLGLDNIKQSYEYKMVLTYDEDEIAKLSSIKVSPVSPSKFLMKN